MEPVRIAVIGAGLIGRRHAGYVAACPDARLIAIVDPDPATEAVAAELGAAWFSDPAKMLAAGGVDGAVVATPTDLHEEVGLACVAAGVHAIIEKPIAHTLEAAERLNAAAEAAGVFLLTGHHRRYNPAVAEARRLIDTGALGRLVGVSGLWAIAKPPAYFAPAWRRAAGGGPVLINLIHEIDSLRAIVGEIVEITAMTSNATREHETEDTAALTLRFDNGALGTILLSDTAPSPWTWEQGSGESHPQFPEGHENATRFLGTEASLEFPRLKLWRQNSAPDWMEPIAGTELPLPRTDVYTDQIYHFVQVIRGQEQPIVSGREGQKTLAATLAVFDAAETSQTVHLT